MNRIAGLVLAVTVVMVMIPAGPVAEAGGDLSNTMAFKTTTGGFTVSLSKKDGAVLIRSGGKTALGIRELGGNRGRDVLYYATSVRRSGSSYTLTGSAPWTSFTFRLDAPSNFPGLLHWTLALSPRKDPPLTRRLVPDVQVFGGPASGLRVYAPAPPVAGSSVFVSDAQMKASALYFADYTRLGAFFDRSRTGVTQSVFSYPNAGDKGSLVGSETGSFGFIQPPDSVQSLPRNKSTVVVNSYLVLQAGVPKDEADTADRYLRALSLVWDAMRVPTPPTADWPALADQEAAALADSSNWVTVGGSSFLKAYVSDTRIAPELITQAGVLAGLKAWEAKTGKPAPMDMTLEKALPAFYDPEFHAVVNGLETVHDPNATEESWYFVGNMISLLQLAQLGSGTARKLLLDSSAAVMALAHTSNYEFPLSFRWRDFSGGQSGLQADVAGGYAWLMLGLLDMTGESRYLDEAKASIAHVGGKGFGLSYETHMTAYTAAAAERLFTMTGDARYHGYALLALANLFHATRLWDCGYGLCTKGKGYHTLMGLNPLPWADYVAMREQYEAWLGLRDLAKYMGSEPAYVQSLVNAFLTDTPRSMQYALPTLLPAGAATAVPSEYATVSHNNLGWSVPLEDLREGESTSGVIGQEIYGAGGPFWFAAYG